MFGNFFSREPTATACLIIKDEGRYLPEWLAHYFTLGFDRILIYDNGSRAETLAIEQACAALDRRIEIVSWPDEPGQPPQTTAYRNALARCKTEWIAFFDTDEFLVLKKHNSIGSYLRAAPAKAGAVAINWLLFGSGGEIHYRPEPVTTRFQRCSRRASVNVHVKCIARKAGCVSVGHAHSPDLKAGFVYVDSEMRPVTLDKRAFNTNYSFETAQLNHYVLRSREEFDWKRARGCALRPRNHPDKFSKFDDPEGFWKGHDFNDESDTSVLRWTAQATGLREAFENAVASETATMQPHALSA